MEENGYYLILDITIEGYRFTIGNIHVAPQKCNNLVAQFMESISTLGNESLIIGGDFNEILNPSLDTNSPTNASTQNHKNIANYLESWMLADIWHEMHPMTHRYTIITNKNNPRPLLLIDMTTF